MALSADTRELMAYKWYCELLGRKPTTTERKQRAEQIVTSGSVYVYASLYESTEAAAFRNRRGW